MNRDQFIKYLISPEKLDSPVANKLDELLEEFPYFQTARILHLKALHNEKSIHYPNRLKITAAYASDRKALYKFIMQDELLNKIDKLNSEFQNEKHASEEKIKNKETPESQIISQGNLSQTLPIIQEKTQEIPDKKVTEITEDKNPDKVSSKESKEEGKNEELEKSLTASSINEKGTIETEKQSEPFTDNSPEDFNTEKSNEAKSIFDLETEILKEAISAGIGFEMNRNTEEKANESTEVKEVETPIQIYSNSNTRDEKHSFSQWMKLLKNSEVKTEKINKLSDQTEKDKLNISDGGKTINNKQEYLIEKFIQEEPKIKPRKAEFFSPVNMAKLSMVENDGFVTETLAKVYAKQGNTAKAIRAFENLILKYPEKTAYFAAQIEQLKQKK